MFTPYEQKLLDEIKALEDDHRDFQQEIGTLNQLLGMRDAEIEVLERERDNALLRVEELEAENADQAQVIDQQRDVIASFGNRGGVHPNA